MDSLSSRLVKAVGPSSQAADLRTRLEEKQMCLSAFLKGFFLFSVPLHCRSRAAAFRRLVGFFSAVNLADAQSHQLVARSLFSQLRIPPREATHACSQTLGRLLTTSFLGVSEEEGEGGGRLQLHCHVTSGLLDRAAALGRGGRV